MVNPFFKNTGPHLISNLLKTLDLKCTDSNEHVKDIKDLHSSESKDITFYHSKKYIDFAKVTKASFCITTENLKSSLPRTCKAIISDKVLLHTAKITEIFYPDSVSDYFDNTVKDIGVTEFKEKVNYGKNVLIGPNVVIRSSNHNYAEINVPIINQGMTKGEIIIEDNVWISSNCVILPNCTIGEGAIVAAGAVVTKDIEPYSIVGGIPAKKIGVRSF